MFISLFTTRIVLSVLGSERYGLYTLIAGFVLLLSFLSNSLATATQRYLSFEIGRNDDEQLTKVFQLSVIVYCIIAVIILFCSETFGLFFLRKSIENINYSRKIIIFVYQLSIATFIITILSTSLKSLVIAHEDMKYFAFIGLFESFLLLLLVLLLLFHFQIDKLLLYSFFVFLTQIVTFFLYLIVCKHKYKECTFSFFWDKKMFLSQVSYVGWNLFGSLSGVLKNHGTNILLSFFFGTTVIASRSIAQQISNAVNSFAVNFSTAVRPPIIKSYAEGDIEKTVTLLGYSTKFIYFLLLILIIPVISEIETILKVWLGSVPQYASLFTKFALIEILLESSCYSVMTAIQATGKIKKYQLIVGGTLLLNIPIAYLSICNYNNPLVPFIVSIVISFIAVIIRIHLVREIFSKFYKAIIINVFGRMVLTTVIASISVYLIYSFSYSALLRWILYIIFTLSILPVFILFIGLNREERQFLYHSIVGRINN